MSQKFKERDMHNYIIVLLLSFLVFLPGCDMLSRQDVLPVIEQAQTAVDSSRVIVQDLVEELETLPADSPQRDEVVAALNRAWQVLDESERFLAESKEIMADVEASSTEVGFGILEIGLSALGFGGAAGYAGAARRASRRNRQQLKIIEEGLTSADLPTLAKLDADIAKAILAEPKQTPS